MIFKPNKQHTQWIIGSTIILIACLLIILVNHILGNNIFTAIAIVGLLAPFAAWLLLKKPAVILYILITIISFGSEYSQTQWGVRSADGFASVYNRRILPGVIASPFDIILVIFVGVWLAKKFLSYDRVKKPPFSLALPLLLASTAVIYALFLGVLNLQKGFELYHVMREVRPLLYFFIVFFLTLDLIDSKEKIQQFVLFLIGLAFIRGVQGIVLHILGVGRNYYGTTMVYYDYSDTILLLIGLFLLFAGILTGIRTKYKSIPYLMLIPIGYSFIFSFRRSFWIGSIVGLLIAFLFLASKEKKRFFNLVAIPILILGLAFPLIGGSVTQIEVFSQRILSIFDTQNDSSNFFRILDMENAINSIYQSGTLGLGFGSRYEVITSTPELQDFIQHVSRASHNGYLYLTLKMGIFGLVSWSLIGFVILRFCFDILRTTNPSLRAFSIAMIAIIVTCAIANIFMPLFYNLRPSLFLAIISGLVTATWTKNQTRTEP